MCSDFRQRYEIHLEKRLQALATLSCNDISIQAEDFFLKFILQVCMNYASVYNSILINFPSTWASAYQLGYTQEHLYLSFVFEDAAPDGECSLLMFVCEQSQRYGPQAFLPCWWLLLSLCRAKASGSFNISVGFGHEPLSKSTGHSHILRLICHVSFLSSM